MSQISVSNLTFGYEGSFDNIFQKVTFLIDTNWKLGLIGRNGKGKTTFLNLLLGKYEYQGTISTQAVFDYFPYLVSEEQMQKNSVDFYEELKPSCELWRIICELEKLRVKADVLYRPFQTLSHGERTKVMLAILFSGENDFLLIDEPTNHLDQESREIVKEYLAQKKGFILVSHDRDLLDACIDHVLVLNRHSIEVQSGNFSSWWENKSRMDAFHQAENEKHKKEIRRLEQSVKRVDDWANKNESTKIGYDPIKEHDRGNGTRPYIGAKTKKMQSRVKNMQKRIADEIEEKQGLLLDIEMPVDLKLMPLRHHKEVLVSARAYRITYKDADNTSCLTVFRDLYFEIRQGERVFLHGKNGCGKSSLIKAILRRNAEFEYCSMQEEGTLETASGLVISYINQDTSH
ncbi:MAG: ATP-binding cassette domain-containing protein, partial [Lachnospiraceae bacterium]|nr:ATP-binding cassette domain-containing protein [Lachnospiraceae bacterium]